MQQKIDFTVGEKYIIDAGHANEGEVEIVSHINSAFVRVKDEFEFEWDILTKRLSEIKK